MIKKHYQPIRCGKYTLDFSRPLIMGILNVTPDSFSDGGQFFDVEKAVVHAKQMAADGADIIDIGGESSRPGSDPVSEEEELRRVLPVVERLLEEVGVSLSIDSYKPRVVEECLKRGVHIVNDIEGLRNDGMIDVVARYNVPVIIMHMLGKPKTMQQGIVYSDVVVDIKIFFEKQVTKAKEKGVNYIILDPGIGFGKSVEHNLELLHRLDEFLDMGCPLLVGTSRKSFIGLLTGAQSSDRLAGSIASSLMALERGASILRVHDVSEMKQALTIWSAVGGMR